jgi:hypothetical protein
MIINDCHVKTHLWVNHGFILEVLTVAEWEKLGKGL